MTRFISQLTTFALIGLLLVMGSTLLLSKCIHGKQLYKVAKNIDKIVVGDSHSECAFNDSLIKDFINVSQSGESYFYTYFKTIEILKYNKNIRYIFIEFTNNQINEEIEDWIWGDKYLNYRYPKYAPFIDYEGNKLLVSKNFSTVINLQVRLLFSDVRTLVTNYDYTKQTGGYLYLEKNKTDSFINALKDRKVLNNNSGKISKYNLSYLEKIIAVCKKQKLHVYLIRSPLHSKYTGQDNEQLFQKVLKSGFASTEFLDFKDFPLTNSEFADLDHVNFRGAGKFSVFFNELIENGLLTKNNKQQFIDSLTNGKKFPKLVQFKSSRSL